MIYWIELPIAGRLGTMARPRAGDWLDDEIEGWRQHGVNRVISLLEPEEIEELELHREASQCIASGIDFKSFPIADRGVPNSLAGAEALAEDIAAQVRAGGAVAIHCRAGIGRASLVAALVLRTLGLDTEAAFEAIEVARGLCVPDTDEQRDFVAAFAPGQAL